MAHKLLQSRKLLKICELSAIHALKTHTSLESGECEGEFFRRFHFTWPASYPFELNDSRVESVTVSWRELAESNRNVHGDPKERCPTRPALALAACLTTHKSMQHV